MVLDLPAPAQVLGLELLNDCQFPDARESVICAVSGGADSLTLLILARLSGLAVTAVHVDHGLRPGSAAEGDVVAGAAAQLGAKFRAERVELVDGPDLEARARKARKSACGPDALTGHTADDQAETLLINLLRGTGVAGLAAMEPGGIHPILAIRRADTVELCRLAGFDPVQDPSNDDARFVRNRVRHELMPLMDSISQRDMTPLLTRTADRARGMHVAIDELAQALDPTDTRQMQTVSPAVAAQCLRRWLQDGDGHPPSSAELDRVFEVVHHRTVACELSGGRRVARSDGVLRLEQP